MKTVFYCFSGTGNTRRVCDALAAELRALGEETEIHRIAAESSPAAPEESDRIVIAYPVHAFNAPEPVLKFLKTFPAAHTAISVFLLRTSGEPLKLNHASGIAPKKILTGKGYRICGEMHYAMPYNIIFRHSDGMAARMELTMRAKVKEDARLLADGKGTLYRVGLFGRSVSSVLRIEHPAMPVIGRHFKTSEACIGCGLCQKVCPQGNIRIEAGKPRFGKNCVGCMGCAFRCPKDAIRISLLNGWRVNGEYVFDKTPASDDEVCKYCHKSYVRYFHSAEDRNQ